MTALYLKIPDGDGGHACNQIPHKITSVPQVRKVAGCKFIPTKFAARHDHMWRRVWERGDGTFYIKAAYRNLDIVIVAN